MNKLQTVCATAFLQLKATGIEINEICAISAVKGKVSIYSCFQHDLSPGSSTPMRITLFRIAKYGCNKCFGMALFFRFLCLLRQHIVTVHAPTIDTLPAASIASSLQRFGTNWRCPNHSGNAENVNERDDDTGNGEDEENSANGEDGSREAGVERPSKRAKTKHRHPATETKRRPSWSDPCSN